MRPEHRRFTIPLRLRSLFRWAQADRELDEELRDTSNEKPRNTSRKGWRKKRRTAARASTWAVSSRPKRDAATREG